MTTDTVETLPQPKARLAGVFYLLTIVAGALAAILPGRGLVPFGNAANLIATCSYVIVTLLFYFIFRPVNRPLSLLAELISLAACAMGFLSALHIGTPRVNSLVLFGCYCLLIGYLVFRSGFLPRFLGVLMAFGGLGWLTFLSPSLASDLSPYNLAPGVLGESALTFWLLVAGVNVQRWKALTSAG